MITEIDKIRYITIYKGDQQDINLKKYDLCFQRYKMPCCTNICGNELVNIDFQAGINTAEN